MRRVLSPGISNQRRFAILAPKHGEIPVSFFNVAADQLHYSELLAGMQRLRGEVYLADGAINASQLTADGRHELTTDEQSWHLLLVENDTSVVGCMRYLRHRRDVLFSRTGVAKSALARCGEWGEKLRQAVRIEVQSATEAGLGFAEAGGWALAPELRGSSAALSLVLGIYGLAQLLGEAYVLSTATVRNGSARMLQRLGGARLTLGDQELPAYYDPTYGCQMEVLRFDSRSPNPKYGGGVVQLRSELVNSSVLRSETLAERLMHFGAPLPNECAAEARA